MIWAWTETSRAETGAFRDHGQDRPLLHMRHAEVEGQELAEIDSGGGDLPAGRVSQAT